jgi:4-hydroxy-tetrahydrodipicolinate synthase
MGVWPVMLTPFTSDGAIDWAGVEFLTEWYLDAGAAGLFAVCLSSEMYHLTDNERRTLAARVVRQVAGRVPVVATGTFGGTVAQLTDDILCMAENGVAAVVVNVNQVAEEAEAETVWQERVAQLLAQTGETPLGLYECPRPYHRLLSAEMLGWAASTGRFVFHKDVACAMAPIRAKLAAVQGTPLRWLNANTPTLLDSLLAGGGGFCGTGANIVPALYVWLCRNASHPYAQRLQRFLSIADLALRAKYPASAKVFLSRSGLSIQPTCRAMTATFTEEELLALDHLGEMAGELSEVVF